ncbi:hypothetical protein YEEN111655_04320 [Yersinia entomophaga]
MNGLSVFLDARYFLIELMLIIYSLENNPLDVNLGKQALVNAQSHEDKYSTVKYAQLQVTHVNVGRRPTQ